MAEDRRRAFRRNAFTFGTIALAEGEVGCLVWNETEGGALIEIEQASPLPARLRLRLSPRVEFRDATVVWQEGNRAGVAFTP